MSKLGSLAIFDATSSFFRSITLQDFQTDTLRLYNNTGDYNGEIEP